MVWSVLENEIDKFFSLGLEIETSFKRLSTEPELEELTASYNTWMEKVNTYLPDVLKSDDDEFNAYFLLKKNRRFRIPGQPGSLETG